MKRVYSAIASISFLLLSLLLPLYATAQSYYNQTPKYIKANSQWAFNNGVVLDFNSAPPAPFIGINILYSQGIASVANPVTGQLLFQSNGEQCWNTNNDVMQNGDSLLGNSFTLSGGVNWMPYGTGGGTVQGVCIVPFIHDAGKYYLFSLNGPANWISGVAPTGYCLYYSVVDMALDGGLGGIVTGQKNIPLYTMNKLPSASMIAVPGNNCDIWLIMHDYIDPVFRSYHITGQGVDTNAVVSVTGSQVQGAAGNGAYFYSNMAVSPNRDYLAITSYTFSTQGSGALLCRFDPATGIVSDALQIGNNKLPLGVAFSPDNTKLYLTHSVDTSVQVLQYDIGTFDSAIVAATEQSVGNCNTNYPATSMKSYQDKIYVLSGGSFLDVINQPNLTGTLADLESTNNLFVAYSASLPNDVVFAFPADTVYTTHTVTFCHTGILTAAASGGVWSDGSTADNLSVTEAGSYWHSYTAPDCKLHIDTFIVSLGLSAPPVITMNNFVLSTTAPFDTYQWYRNGAVIPGATFATYTVSQNGDYTVVVSDTATACTDTAAIYTIDNITGVHPINGLAGQIYVYPNPTDGDVWVEAPVSLDLNLTDITGRSMLSHSNNQHISLAHLLPGIYLLRISDHKGDLLKVVKIARQ